MLRMSDSDLTEDNLCGVVGDGTHAICQNKNADLCVRGGDGVEAEQERKKDIMIVAYIKMFI